MNKEVTEKQVRDFDALPTPKSCRIIDFDSARVVTLPMRSDCSPMTALMVVWKGFGSDVMLPACQDNVPPRDSHERGWA